MDEQIRFIFEGINYVAPAAFYDVEACILPDGRVLSATRGFLEKIPPVPDGLKVIDEPGDDLPRTEVAS